jgi:hypothetical protein
MNDTVGRITFGPEKPAHACAPLPKPCPRCAERGK